MKKEKTSSVLLQQMAILMPNSQISCAIEISEKSARIKLTPCVSYMLDDNWKNIPTVNFVILLFL